VPAEGSKIIRFEAGLTERLRTNVIVVKLGGTSTLRAGLGVSPASPSARATPHPRATKIEKKKFILYIKKKKKKIYICIRKKKKKNCMHKIKFLLEDKKYIFRKYWTKIKNNHKLRAKNIQEQK
jgi:hypothetical protein